MSVLMNAGKKAAQAKAQKEQERKKKKATAAAKATATKRHNQAAATAPAAAVNQGPPMSNPMTSVWYWVLDGRPTTVMYHKPKKEVWCNGYLLDTYEGFQEDPAGDLSQDIGDTIDFSIYAAESQRNHRGRIERIPTQELSWPACESSDGLVLGSHRLWVNESLIPEYTDQPRNYSFDNSNYFQDYYYDDDDEYSLSGRSLTTYQ